MHTFITQDRLLIAMTTSEACCKREGVRMMSLERMSTDVIVGPDDSTMRKLRVNVSNICTSAYTQGLAARTSKEITSRLGPLFAGRSLRECRKIFQKS